MDLFFIRIFPNNPSYKNTIYWIILGLLKAFRKRSKAVFASWFWWLYGVLEIQDQEEIFVKIFLKICEEACLEINIYIISII